MSHPQSILAFVDHRPESRIALEKALALAQRTGGKVTVMDVLESPRWPWQAKLHDLSLGKRRLELFDVAERMRHERVSVDVALRSGRPSVELVRAVLAQGHDWVIKAAKGRAEGRGSLFGSTAMHLIRKCPSPVWIVGPQGQPTGPRILAAIDASWGDDPAAAAFARKTLATATALASNLGAELHVVHAWQLYGESLLSNRVSGQELSDLLRREREVAERQLIATVDEVGEPVAPERIHLEKGSPEQVIPRLARELGVDAIVMGTVGRSGLAGLLIGEMAEEILNRVDCGVVCVKPDGFVSPVKLDVQDDARLLAAGSPQASSRAPSTAA